jgi:hypothetical protein
MPALPFKCALGCRGGHEISEAGRRNLTPNAEVGQPSYPAPTPKRISTMPRGLLYKLGRVPESELWRNGPQPLLNRRMLLLICAH